MEKVIKKGVTTNYIEIIDNTLTLPQFVQKACLLIIQQNKRHFSYQNKNSNPKKISHKNKSQQSV